MFEMIKKKLDELTKTVKKQNDEQIKFRRAYEDQINNLDEDNIPKLSGIVQENTKNGQTIAAIVSSDGEGGYTANASLILSSINGQSSATLRADKVDFNAGTYTVGADHISLAGKTINMTGDNIKITSTNFNVDRTGKATMNAAVIKKGCILGSDITEGAGIQVGAAYTDANGIKSDVKIFMTGTEVLGNDSARGINLKAMTDLQNNNENVGGVITLNPADVSLKSNDGTCAVGVKREYLLTPFAFMNTESTSIELHDIDGEGVGNPYIELKVGNVFLKISETGITCGNGTTTKTLL